MKITEQYSGFRIEVEGEPLTRSVVLKIFALEPDGSSPDPEPTNVVTYDASDEYEAHAAELMRQAVVHARSAIDKLVGESPNPSEAEDQTNC